MDARSPDELETLLEDAVLLADGVAAASLFEPAGVLAAGPAATTVARRDPVTGAWRYAIVVPRAR